MTDLFRLLTAHGRTALTTERTRTFEAAVERFAQTLAVIPDYPAAEMSDEGFTSVIALAEQVIAKIEHRLDANDLNDSGRQRVTESVYDIRRGLEEAARWRRHYMQA
jgi:hypothetical protein